MNNNNNNNNNNKNNINNNTNINNRTLIIRLSNCGKSYFMKYILLRKQEPNFMIIKSLNHYANIKAQTSDESQPLNENENTTVVFDDMLLSKQGSNNDLFFTGGRHNNIDIYYTSQGYFDLPKNTIRNNSNIYFLIKQSLRDIKLLFHDIAGLDMKLEEWKELCRRPWEKHYDYLQIDRLAKTGHGRCTIRNCNKITYIECTSETKPF